MRRIELRAGDDGRHDAGVLLAELKGAPAGETPDPAEVEAFCARLNKFTFRSYRSNLNAPDRTPLPRGHRNVRIVDGRDGECLGSIWWVGEGDVPNRVGAGYRVVTKRPDAQKIISVMLCMPFEEIVEWRSTVAAPAAPGILELVVDLTTRPRTLLPYDGSPLPPELADWHSSRAPAKARRHDIS